MEHAIATMGILAYATLALFWWTSRGQAIHPVVGVWLLALGSPFLMTVLGRFIEFLVGFDALDILRAGIWNFLFATRNGFPGGLFTALGRDSLAIRASEYLVILIIFLPALGIVWMVPGRTKTKLFHVAAMLVALWPVYLFWTIFMFFTCGLGKECI